MSQMMFHEIEFTPGEREVFRKRENLTVSQWARRHVILFDGPFAGQPWRNSRTRYLTEVMDTYCLPWVRKIVVVAAPQTGKTSAMYNCLGFMADRAPGRSLIVMPDEVATRRISKERIKPMFNASPRLSSLKSPNSDDFAAINITLRNGMSINLGWANSPSLMASLPIKYLFLDESDKFKDLHVRETDSVRLAELRTRTHVHDKKIFICSSPSVETGHIWTHFNQCAEIRDFYVVCPDCGTVQKMVFKQFDFPEDERDPTVIKENRLVRYKCIRCQSLWTDLDRNEAVLRGQWQARHPVHRPRSIGFHIPAFISPFVSLSESAAEFLESQGSKAALRNFMNAHEAIPWVDWKIERSEDRILALRDDRQEGLVPKNTAALTAGVDTQDNGFYFVVRAWGWGQELESWLVRAGFVDTFEALEKVLTESSYKDADNREYPIVLALQDSLGHRTAEVYDFTRKLANVWPHKGGDRRLTRPWSPSQIDCYPGTKKPIPGGVILYHLDVHYYKDWLAGKLAVAPEDPGAFHLHAGTSHEYARQMCVQYVDDRGLWQKKQGQADHYWDCEVYAAAAADVIQVKFWKRPEDKARPTGSAKPITTGQSGTRQRPAWFERR